MSEIAQNKQNTQSMISEQLTQLTELERLLDAEKEVLQQHEPSALIEVSEAKNQLLLSIQSLDKLISQMPNFSEERASGIYDDMLNETETTLARCQEKNLINGQIVHQSQLAVERMKTTLLDSHNKSAVTYDSKGKKSAGLSSLGIKA